MSIKDNHEREAMATDDDIDDPDAVYVTHGDIDLWIRAQAAGLWLRTSHYDQPGTEGEQS